jgi:hypothetical protein
MPSESHACLRICVFWLCRISHWTVFRYPPKNLTSFQLDVNLSRKRRQIITYLNAGREIPIFYTEHCIMRKGFILWWPRYRSYRVSNVGGPDWSPSFHWYHCANVRAIKKMYYDHLTPQKLIENLITSLS